MSKRTKAIIGTVIIFLAIVGVLLMNRSRMQAKSKPEEIKFLPVTTTMVSRQKLSESFSLTGTISANNDVLVTSETQGRITKVYVNVGDRVEAGSVLVQVDDELKRAAYTAAEANYDKTKKDFERFEAMSKDGSVSDAQLEGARLSYKSAEAQYIMARRQYNDTKIKSPISGIVATRPVDVGTNLQNNNLVANVVDVSKLKVKLNVAERDAFKLKVGDKVEVSTDVYPGITFVGRVETISSKADDGHTYPVEVTLANSAKNPLKAGMFGRVSFVSIKDIESLTIPRQSLVGSMKNPQVFVVDRSVARLRDVVIGSEVGSNLEVLSGLRLGEEIVVSGQNNLKDSVSVTVLK